MAKKLENIFNECLERMLQGETIESCLESYPEEAAQLEPLLKTALDVSGRASSLQPRPEFKVWARARLEGAQLHPEQRRQPERPGFFAWQRGWAWALTTVLVILFAGAGTAVASSGASPDESVYPVKLATERVRLAFTFSNAGKAELHTQLAKNRAMEIAAMAREGKTEQVVIVTEGLATHLEEASYAVMDIAKPEVEAPSFKAAPEEAATAPAPAAAPEEETATAPELMGREAAELDTAEVGEVQQLKEVIIAILESALDDTPEPTKPALQQAIDISKKSYAESP